MLRGESASEASEEKKEAGVISTRHGGCRILSGNERGGIRAVFAPGEKPSGASRSAGSAAGGSLAAGGSVDRWFGGGTRAPCANDDDRDTVNPKTFESDRHL